MKQAMRIMMLLPACFGCTSDAGNPPSGGDGLTDGTCEQLLDASGCSGTEANQGNDSGVGGEQRRSKGQPCMASKECATGYCADGVCCDVECSGVCEACNEPGRRGECSFVERDSACPSTMCPGDAECLTAASSSLEGTCSSRGVCLAAVTACEPAPEGTRCGSSAACDGSGNCATRASLGEPCEVDSQCASGSCSGGICCDTECDGACEQCNDAGRCEALQSGTCSLPACSAETSCVFRPDCAAEGNCAEPSPLGTACDTAAECASGYCADGTCCEEACGGICERCDDPTSTGVCVAAIEDAACPSATCPGDLECLADSAQAPQGVCADRGVCLATTISCIAAPPGTSCGDQAYCDSYGLCIAQNPLGAPCDRGYECDGGFCADGVCCSEACDEACEECDGAGSCRAPINQYDPACPLVSCPQSTSCTTYAAEVQVCLSKGVCATSASDCRADFAPAATPCAAGYACDGAGECSLLVDGAGCTRDVDCVSGACLAGTCGVAVRSCADIGLIDNGRMVTRYDMLDGRWPSGNPPGEVVLVGGKIGEVVKYCLDDVEVAVRPVNAANVEIVMPSGNVGDKLLRLVDAAGRVSQAEVVSITSSAQTFPSYNGVPILEEIPPGFQISPVDNLPLVTNDWRSGQWTYTVDGSGISMSAESELTREIEMTGIGDAATLRTRIQAVIHHCNGADCTETAEYLAVFSCPDSVPSLPVPNSDAGLVDPCRHPTSSVFGPLDGFEPVIVLFPVAPSGRRGGIYLGSAPWNL